MTIDRIHVKTYCDVVRKLKELLTVLGIEYWYVYFMEWYFWGSHIHTTSHTDKEPCIDVKLGQTDTPIVALEVIDPIMGFFHTQEFFFERDD